MSSTAQIRAALKVALDAAFASSWNTSAYMLASPNPPQMEIIPAGVDYDTAMARGNDDLHYLVRAIVQHGGDVSAQENLDGLIDVKGAASMKVALEADKTLGGVVSDLRVTDVSEYKVYAQDLLGVEFSVELYP